MITRVKKIFKKLKKSYQLATLFVNIDKCFFFVRLWGDHGQGALEGAKICLINASATGTEILKNLILPGSVKFFS